MQGDQSMGLIIPRSWLPSDAGSSSMVSDSVLELLTTSALALEEPVLSAAGTESTLAKSTLLVKPMPPPPPRTLTWGSGAGATPVDMALSEPRCLAHAILRAPAGQPTLVVR
jgi:hypothetical protein